MPMSFASPLLGTGTWAQMIAAFPNGASNAPIGSLWMVTDFPPNRCSMWVRVTESGGPWWAPLNGISWPIEPTFSTTGDTSYHTAYSFTLKAGMMRLSGTLEFARVQWYGTNNGNGKRLRLSIDGTSIDSNEVTTGSLAPSFGIQNQGSQSAQTYWWQTTSGFRSSLALNTATDLTVALELANTASGSDTSYLTGGFITLS